MSEIDEDIKINTISNEIDRGQEIFSEPNNIKTNEPKYKVQNKMESKNLQGTLKKESKFFNQGISNKLNFFNDIVLPVIKKDEEEKLEAERIKKEVEYKIFENHNLTKIEKPIEHCEDNISMNKFSRLGNDQVENHNLKEDERYSEMEKRIISIKEKILMNTN